MEMRQREGGGCLWSSGKLDVWIELHFNGDDRILLRRSNTAVMRYVA
jgi:hypothetical protein